MFQVSTREKLEARRSVKPYPLAFQQVKWKKKKVNACDEFAGKHFGWKNLIKFIHQSDEKKAWNIPPS